MDEYIYLCRFIILYVLLKSMSRDVIQGFVLGFV